MPSPEATLNWVRKSSQWTLLSLFLAALTVPPLAGLFGYDPTPPVEEKRRLRSFPTLKSWSAFPGEFEAYYADRFGLRNTLIRWHSILMVCGLGVSSSPTVVVGRDGWLFYAPDVETRCTRFPLPEEQLLRWQRGLEQVQQQLAAQQIPYLLVVAPSPCSIYQQFLPAGRRQLQPATPLDQFLRHMRQQSAVPILDLREALLNHQALGRLYHRTDTHWNERGAFVAYQAIIQSLTRWFPEMQPLPWAAFEEQTSLERGGDMAAALALSDLFTEAKIRLLPREPRRAQLVDAAWAPWGEPYHMTFTRADLTAPRALFLHDSFTYVGLYPFLAEHFSRITFFWPKEDRVVPSRIPLDQAKEKPQVVIQELVERTLLIDTP